MKDVVTYEPLGYCQCGCGSKTTTITMTSKRDGRVKGQPNRFLAKHTNRRHPLDCYTEDENGCWNWNGYKDDAGYGRVNIGEHNYAHRYFYDRFGGGIIPNQPLDHICRNRACVNPDHLEPVSQVENVRRGRVCKLTFAEVVEIRQLTMMPGGLTYKDAADIYGVSHQNVGHIARNENWRGVQL